LLCNLAYDLISIYQQTTEIKSLVLLLEVVIVLNILSRR